MMPKNSIVLFLCLIISFGFEVGRATDAGATLPKGFVYVDAVIPELQIEIRYFTLQNEPYPDTYFDFPIK